MGSHSALGAHVVKKLALLRGTWKQAQWRARQFELPAAMIVHCYLELHASRRGTLNRTSWRAQHFEYPEIVRMPNRQRRNAGHFLVGRLSVPE